MQLKIKPYQKNSFPLRGIFIQGVSPSKWIEEIQFLGLRLSEISVYPLPDNQANSTWGCFVIYPQGSKIKDIRRNEYAQLIHDRLFIPERSIISPLLNPQEMDKLFGVKYHVAHPEFGWVELNEAVNWIPLLEDMEQQVFEIQIPADSLLIPEKIISFQVISLSPEEALENLDLDFPQSGKLDNRPLSNFEKGKLAFYRQLLFSKNSKDGAVGKGIDPSGLLKSMNPLMKWLSPDNTWTDQMQEDYEDLERRNQKEVNKLLDLFKTNPEEALKYAIPLDENNSGRGGMSGGFTLSKRWSNFSFGGGRGGNVGSGGVDLGDRFFDLRNQYMETAAELIRKGDYHKAAFIYLKLLKNYRLAAETLEKGGLYQEAASIYLKYLGDKKLAAACYEKGNYISKAIELYDELKQFEKVGDLYLKLNKRKEANFYFEKAVQVFKSNHQYIKASLIYRNKMADQHSAQEMLLDGWRIGKDGFNCLNNYFNNIQEEPILWETIQQVYQDDVPSGREKDFLHVIKLEYKKRKEINLQIRELAYEIIGKKIKSDPSFSAELMAFNKRDHRLVKDTIWYRYRKF